MIKKAKNTYFFMTNQKGDFGCFFFKDYELYKRTWLRYKEIGYIDEDDLMGSI
tara:strand:+ start:51 stop:209 length:159 start_codon:yes stop_codon:yes gene_type:complete